MMLVEIHWTYIFIYLNQANKRAEKNSNLNKHCCEFKRKSVKRFQLEIHRKIGRFVFFCLWEFIFSLKFGFGHKFEELVGKFSFFGQQSIHFWSAIPHLWSSVFSFSGATFVQLGEKYVSWYTGLLSWPLGQCKNNYKYQHHYCHYL